MEDWYPTEKALGEALKKNGGELRLLGGWYLGGRRIQLIEDKKNGRGWTWGYY